MPSLAHFSLFAAACHSMPTNAQYTQRSVGTILAIFGFHLYTESQLESLWSLACSRYPFPTPITSAHGLPPNKLLSHIYFVRKILQLTVI